MESKESTNTGPTTHVSPSFYADVNAMFTDVSRDASTATSAAGTRASPAFSIPYVYADAISATDVDASSTTALGTS